MKSAYLGLFSTIFNWVFEKILSPIIEFLAGLLSSVFEWIFENILVPILTLVIETVTPWLVKFFKDLFAELFYKILAYLCELVDFLEETFDIFAGTTPVKDVTRDVSDSLLNIVIFNPTIKKLFYMVMAIAFVLTLTFAVISVAKATFDLEFNGRKPVAQVMRTLFKTMIQFMIVPLMVLFILNLASKLLVAIEDSTKMANGTTGNPSLGSTVFAITSLDASVSPSENVSGNSSTSKNFLNEGVRGYFYRREAGWDYTSLSSIRPYFKFADFDFFTGYAVCIFLIIILAATAIVFVQRIFEVVILYVICPFFVSTMPLDEGEKYKKWKELFFGKLFGGYGSILGMKIYLMLVPFIMGNSIVWGNSSNDSAYLMKLLFIVGGAWATFKLGPMVTGLISAEAAQGESATSGMVGGMAGSALATAAVKSAQFTGKLAGMGIGALAGSSKESDDLADQKFDDMRKAQMEDSGELPEDEESDGKGGGADIPDKPGDGESGDSRDTENNMEDFMNEADEKEDQEEKDNGADIGDKPEDTEGKPEDTEDGEKDNEADIDDKQELGEDTDEPADDDDPLNQSFNDNDNLTDEELEDRDIENTLGKDALEEKKEESESKEEEKGNKYKQGTAKTQNKFDKFLGLCHRVLPHKANKDGSYSFGLLGFRVNYDKDGNRTGFKIPCVKFKYDDKGNVRLHKMNFGIAKIQREPSSGSMKLKSIPLIGLNRKADKETGEFNVTRIGALGINREKGKDGSYHVSKIGALGITRSQINDKGEYGITGVSPIGLKMDTHKNGERTVSSIAGLKFGSVLNKQTGHFETSGVRVGNMIFGGGNYVKGHDGSEIKPNKGTGGGGSSSSSGRKPSGGGKSGSGLNVKSGGNLSGGGSGSGLSGGSKGTVSTSGSGNKGTTPTPKKSGGSSLGGNKNLDVKQSGSTLNTSSNENHQGSSSLGGGKTLNTQTSGDDLNKSTLGGKSDLGNGGLGNDGGLDDAMSVRGSLDDSENIEDGFEIEAPDGFTVINEENGPTEMVDDYFEKEAEKMNPQSEPQKDSKKDKKGNKS